MTLLGKPTKPDASTGLQQEMHAAVNTYRQQGPAQNSQEVVAHPCISSDTPPRRSTWLPLGKQRAYFLCERIKQKKMERLCTMKASKTNWCQFHFAQLDQACSAWKFFWVSVSIFFFSLVQGAFFSFCLVARLHLDFTTLLVGRDTVWGSESGPPLILSCLPVSLYTDYLSVSVSLLLWLPTPKTSCFVCCTAAKCSESFIHLYQKAHQLIP